MALHELDRRMNEINEDFTRQHRPFLKRFKRALVKMRQERELYRKAFARLSAQRDARQKKLRSSSLYRQWEKDISTAARGSTSGG
jgi:hypothetical protein